MNLRALLPTLVLVALLLTVLVGCGKGGGY
jgi:hypothetical protein